MAKRITIYDPYRNTNTTLADFARAEGVPKYTVSHYFWTHRSLENFRERPPKGAGNGIRPHTYMRNGEFISIAEAARIAGVSRTTLTLYSQKGIFDVDEIKESQQRKRQESLRVIPSDSGLVTQTDYARKMNVSANTVYQYVNHHGDLRGFTTRGHSRVNPKLYRHDGMGVAKSMKDWAEFFGCSCGYVKQWAYRHGQKMDGFKVRKAGRQPYQVEYDGKSATLKEWAEVLGIPINLVSGYYYRHKTLDGIETRKRGRKRCD